MLRWFRDENGRPHWPVIGAVLALVLLLVIGGIALASSGKEDDTAGFGTPGPVGGGGGGIPSGGSGDTGGGTPPPDHFQEILGLATDTTDQVRNSVNTFWARFFPQWWPNIPYRAPSPVQSYRRGEVPPTACGGTPQNRSHNAFVCLKDDSISYELELIQEAYASDDSGPVAILAHEWYHHIQLLIGQEEKYTVSSELAADCGAGLYFQWAGKQGMLDMNDRVNAAYEFYKQGGKSTLWYRPGYHGTPEQRSAAFNTGFYGTVTDCYTIGTKPPLGETAVSASPFEQALLAGMKAEAAPLNDTNSYRITVEDSKTYAYVDGLEGVTSDPVATLHKNRGNVTTIEPNVRELVLSSDKADNATVVIADVLDTNLPKKANWSFAAEWYTYRNQGVVYDGIIFVLTTQRGGYQLIVQGPSVGQTRSPDVDFLAFQLIAGMRLP
jgi:uncharacterized protein